MKIIWSPEAKADLLSIFTYIAEEDLQAAIKQRKLIFDSISKLMKAPSIGRPGRVHETRELVIPNTRFIIPYRVVSETVQILRVFHSSQNWKRE